MKKSKKILPSSIHAHLKSEFYGSISTNNLEWNNGQQTDQNILGNHWKLLLFFIKNADSSTELYLKYVMFYW